MEISITKELIPVHGRGDLWERPMYSVVAWSADVDPVSGQLVNIQWGPGGIPEGYVLGLLVCRIDGRKVPLHEFDEVLKTAGYMNRHKIHEEMVRHK